MSRARGKDFFSIRGATHRAIILASSTFFVGVSLYPVTLRAATASQVGTVTFSIRPQPLATALTAFGTQTGWAVSVPNELLTGLNSSGVQGQQAPAAALATLLSGTGLTYQITGARSVIVQKAVVTSAIRLGPVRVQGQIKDQTAASIVAPYAGGQVASGGRMGFFGNRSVMDTPFNVTSYTAQLVNNQQARQIADVLQNDPSVRITTSDVSFNPQFSIRGFNVSSWDVSLDGLYGLLPSDYAAVDYAERVEVLKGPSAFLNGMAPQGSVGGTINISPKRAQDVANTSATFLYTSRAQFGGQVDIGRRFGRDNAFGVRLNGTYRNGDTAIRNNSQELASLMLSLDYRSRRFRASADLGFQKQVMDGTPRFLGLASGVGVPKPPRATSNWAQPWTTQNADNRFMALHAEYNLTKNWILSAAAGLKKESDLSIWPSSTLTSDDGTIRDLMFVDKLTENVNTENVRLQGKFRTWVVKHDFSFDLQRYFNTRYTSYPYTIMSNNIYHPEYVAKPTLENEGRPKSSNENLSSLAFGDTMSFFRDKVEVFAGGRWQHVEAHAFSATTGATTSHYSKTAVTPAVGITIKPWKNTAIYGNYIQGLQEGTIVGSGYTNSGEVFSPYKSTQLEIGIKHDFGKVILTSDYFQISQPSSYADANTNTYVQSGLQRNRGFEINAAGKLLSNLRAVGGVMWINGILSRTAGGAYNGNQAVGVPHLQLNASLEWDMPYVKGLTLTGRSVYTSSQYYDQANTQKIPSWVRFDIGARYKTKISGKYITFRGDIHNIGGLNYWSSAMSGLTLGAPRTFLFSATADF